MTNRYARGCVLSVIALSVATLLAACGGSSEQEVTEERPHSVIGDPLQESLERAQSVQNTVDEQAAELRQRIEEAEGR